MDISMQWKGFQKPKRLRCKSLTDTYGKFIAEPLEKGYGVTLGNSLRRVLLSSLTGAAVTSVKIDGVLHEFSTIRGVEEDTAEIILNLKELRLRAHKPNPGTVYIKTKEEGEVLAGDIITDPDVEILNPDLHIATLGKGAKLEMAIEVDTGRGYIPAGKNIEENQPIGTIPVDSIFTPVTKVKYEVEDTRVGQKTDYDRLIMEVWTDGSVNPEDAVAFAAKILKDQLTVFLNFEEPAEELLEEEGLKEEMAKTLSKSVEELELSVRTGNCLRDAEIKTIRDLVKKTEGDLLDMKNFGKKSLQELKDSLAKFDFTLGMKID